MLKLVDEKYEYIKKKNQIRSQLKLIYYKKLKTKIKILMLNVWFKIIDLIQRQNSQRKKIEIKKLIKFMIYYKLSNKMKRTRNFSTWNQYMRETQLKFFEFDQIFDRNEFVAIVLYKRFIIEKIIELQKRTQTLRFKVNFDKMHKQKKMKNFFKTMIETMSFKFI